MSKTQTILELANGSVVKTSESSETIEEGIAASLDRMNAVIGPDQRITPRGFVRVPVKGGDVLINAAQIVQVRAAKTSSATPAGAEVSELAR